MTEHDKTDDDAIWDEDDRFEELAADARIELLEQRAIHGLLTAVHDGADAVAREQRVQSIVQCLPMSKTRTIAKVVPMRPWLTLAAAVMITALFTWIFLPGPKAGPVLEAAVLALDDLDDRHFEFTCWKWDESVKKTFASEANLVGRHQFWFRRRPEKNDFLFRLYLDGELLDNQIVGYDGETLWLQSPERKVSEVVARAAKAVDILALNGYPWLADLAIADVHEFIRDARDDGSARHVGFEEHDGNKSCDVLQLQFLADFDGGRPSDIRMLFNRQSHDLEYVHFRASVPGLGHEALMVFKHIDDELPEGLTRETVYQRPW